MEFRYRAGEQRGRPSSSSMNHYYSSSAPIAFTQRRFEGNIPSENLLEKIREERIIEERLAIEMTRKRMIEEEMLAREIARRRMLEEEMFVKEIVRKRMLEEEIMRETEHLNHFPVNNIEEGGYGFDQRMEHGLRYDDANAVIGGSDGLKRTEIGNLEPTICSSRGTPRVSLDMKFPAAKLTGKKRKLTGQKKKLSRNCSLCGVTATNKRELNRHIKGKKHQTKKARLMMTKATSSFNSNADFSVGENCANDEACKKAAKHQRSSKTGWWCKLCQVKCTCEADLQFHLAGKKHKARFEANDEGGEEVEEQDEVV